MGWGRAETPAYLDCPLCLTALQPRFCGREQLLTVYFSLTLPFIAKPTSLACLPCSLLLVTQEPSSATENIRNISAGLIPAEATSSGASLAVIEECLVPKAGPFKAVATR